MASKTQIRSLVNKLEKARKAYYAGDPIMTDKEFDRFENLLRKWDSNNPYFKTERAPVPEDIKKVRLPVPLSSLDKVKADGSLKAWLGTHEGPYLISDKLDGISAVVWNDAKKGVRLLTLGRKNDSWDISVIMPYVKGIGKPRRNSIVRGELVMSGRNFKQFAGEYKNPRNFVAGIATRAGRSKEVHKGAKKLEFHAHGMVKPAKPLVKAVSSLQSMGFTVVKHKKMGNFKNLDNAESMMLKYLASRKGSSRFGMDGIVITDSKGQSKAFKGPDQEHQAIVDRVVWQTSKFGLLKPVAEFVDPVDIDGASISRATLYNAKFVKDNGIGKGAIVKIVRSGEVIPKVVEVIKKVRPSLPRKVEWEWNETNVDIVLKDSQQVDEVKMHKLTSFVRGIGVEGTSGGLIGRIYENGIDSALKLIKSSAQNLQRAGLGPKQANSLRQEIDRALAEINHARMMASSGIFERGWGVTRFEKIFEHFDYSELVSLAQGSANNFYDNLIGVEGLGDKFVRNLKKSVLEYNKWISRIGWNPSKISQRPVDGPLTGETVVFTGFRDKGMQAQIESLGGKVSNTVNKKTRWVVTNDLSSNTGKLKKARDLGVKIITPNKLALELKAA